MKDIYTSFPFDVFRDYMKRAGINSGYQEKPCLDPLDPDCPLSSPNKGTHRAPDIGAELTGGCYGFATRYMHWPEQLIVGGVTKNKTGYIRQAGGLQSMVQLMGPKDMFDYWSSTYKVHSINWSVEKAKEILENRDKMLTPGDVAETVWEVVNKPSNVYIHDVIIKDQLQSIM